MANSSSLAVGRIIVAALGWSGTVLVVRALTPEEFGQFSFVFGLLGLLAITTDLGASRMVLRRLKDADVDRPSFLGTYVVLRLVLAVLTCCLALTYVLLSGQPQIVVHATLLGCLVVLIASPSSALDVVFQDRLQLRPVAVAQVVGQLAQLALTIAVYLLAPSLLLFVLPAVLFDLVVLGWKLRNVLALEPVRPTVQPRVWASILRQAAPVALGGVLATIYSTIDLLLLSELDTFTAVAMYGVALKFVALAAFLPTALTTSLLPVLVSSWPQEPARFHDAVSRSTVLMAVVGTTLLVAFLPVAPDVLAAFYGEPYRQAGLAARVLVGATCTAGYLASIFVTVLVARARNRAYVLLGLVGLVVNVIANVLLIRQFSYEGAAYAAAATAAGVTVVLGLLMLRLPGVRPLPVRPLLLTALAAVLAVGVGVLLDRSAPWPVTASSAVLVHLGLLELLRAPGPGGLRVLLRDA